MERARVVLAALEGASVDAIAVRLHLARNTIYYWLHRFDQHGLAGLEDAPRGGRPPTYSREQVSQIVATALSDPQRLGLPFASWTLDRLVAYLVMNELELMDEDTASHSRGYIAHWLKEEQPPEKAIQQVFRAADAILRAGRIDTNFDTN